MRGAVTSATAERIESPIASAALMEAIDSDP